MASSKPYVPAPPAQPITPADFLGLLRSCPRLVGAWRGCAAAGSTLPPAAPALDGSAPACTLHAESTRPPTHPPTLPQAERILEVGDGLRTVTLVARDAANLCTALGARSSGDGAGTELWRALAASVPGSSKSANAPVAEGACGCWERRQGEG